MRKYISITLLIIGVTFVYACATKNSRPGLERANALASGEFLIYPNSPHSSIAKSIANPCPGTTWCFQNFLLPNPQWGFAPDTNVHVHTFSYPESTNVSMSYIGFFGDSGCIKSNIISIPDPPPSPKYRLTVWFTKTNDLPVGTNDPVTADGFLAP